MIVLSKDQINNSLPQIKRGLEKYLHIRGMMNEPSFYNNPEFRKKYNGFYRMRRGQVFQNIYFELFSSTHNADFTFEGILNKIYAQTNRYEASFASKLVATINDSKPIIDSLVLENTGLILPKYNQPNRMISILEIYNKLESKMNLFLQEPMAKYLVESFDNYFPDATHISPIKKLDFVLWQTRKPGNK